MNHKQKLGYMILGAGIMAVGIIIGQVITPGIEAQSNGVFGEIQCTGLTVVDEQGKVAVLLTTTTEGDKEGSGVYVLDKHENIAVGLGSFKGSFEEGNKMRGHGVFVFNKYGDIAVGLGGNDEVGNEIVVFNKYGKRAAGLSSNDGSNGVVVFDAYGEAAVGLTSIKNDNAVSIFDQAGNIKWSAP